MKIRTLLVDSSYLLKRSVNGAKDVHTDSFGHIGGLYQFFTTLRKIVRDYNINKVVLVWDGEDGGIQRYYIDKKYKANRPDKSWGTRIELTDREIYQEENKKKSLLKQRIRIQAYAEELFLRQIEVETIEADDLIASYCQRYNNKEEIHVFTNDRDFAQLTSLNITIIFGQLNGEKDIPVSKKNFIFNFPYHYKNSLPLKIICGDSADNIDGVPGLKEKGLLKYLPELKIKVMSVREICLRAREINEERVKDKKKPIKALTSLIDSIDRLILNYRLINLDNPFLNEQAVDELEQLEMPLSPEGRSSKNLYDMMVEDEFLTVYLGNFTDYVQIFYPVIMNEKQILKESK